MLLVETVLIIDTNNVSGHYTMELTNQFLLMPTGNGRLILLRPKTRELQYFDSALTDAQLETLTSWTSLQEMITSQLYTNY